MKILLCSLLLVVSSSFCFGQNWLWAKQASGSAYSEGISIARDKNDDVYLVGYYAPTGSQFMIIGSDTLRTNVGTAGFLCKFDSNGNFSWATQSNGYSVPISIATDGKNNVYVTGYFTDTTYFDTQKLYSKYYNAYLVKYNSNGIAVWASAPVVKSSSFNNATYIATDRDNNIYVTGSFADTIIFGADTLIALSGENTFLTKYDTTGNVLWAKSFGGNGPNGDAAQQVTVDKYNCPIIIGSYSSPTIFFGTNTLINSGHSNVFVAKFDPNGNPLWAISDKGTNTDAGNSLTTDKNNNIYISGTYNSPLAIFGKDTLMNSNGPLFFAKYDSAGNEKWAISGSSVTSANSWSLITDSCDDVYISGGCDIRLKIDNTTLYPPLIDADPAFIVELDSAGNYMNGILTPTGGDDWNEIAFDNKNNIYFGGDIEMNAFFGDSVYATGQENAFVSKLSFENFGCHKNTESIPQLKTNPLSLTVFPNPFNNATTIAVTTEGKHYLEVDDLTSRDVMHCVFTGTQYILNAQDLAKGLYFIRVWDGEKNVIGVSKIVIQ